MTTRDNVLNFIVKNPRSTFRDLLTFVTDDKAALTEALVHLADTGQIEKQGFGHASSPYLYSALGDIAA